MSISLRSGKSLSISNFYYSDIWSEKLENIYLFVENVIDIRFESIKNKIDDIVDKKIIKKLCKQIRESGKKGQKLKKINKVN